MIFTKPIFNPLHPPHKTINLVVSIALLILIINLLVLKIHLLSILGLSLFLILFLNFLSEIGSTFPLRSLIALVALLQWVVAPILSYHVYPDSPFFYMSVPEEEYMILIVPSTIAYVVGLFQNSSFTKEKQAFQTMKDLAPYFRKTGFLLFFIGIFGQVIKPFAPATLATFFGLLSNFIIIGSSYLFVSQVRSKWLYLSFAILVLLIDATVNGVFHDLLIWGIYIFSFISIFVKISIKSKLIIIATGIISLFIIQSLKSDFREAISSEELSKLGKLRLLSSLAFDKIVTLDFLESKEDINTSNINVDRFNQGWIISRIINYVPLYEPYARGETITTALRAALVPRILDPQKITSDGRQYFHRFTGIKLSKDTSMNLGLVGEAYVNFGGLGSILFMYIVGLLINMGIKLMYSPSFKNPFLPLWLPFIFFYAIKAEIDFSTLVNQIFKGTLILVTMMFVLRGSWKSEVRRPETEV